MLNDDHILKSADPKSENLQYAFKCWEPKVLSHRVLAWVRVEQVPNPNLFQGPEVYQPDWCASVWGLTQPNLAHRYPELMHLSKELLQVVKGRCFQSNR